MQRGTEGHGRVQGSQKVVESMEGYRGVRKGTKGMLRAKLLHRTSQKFD